MASAAGARARFANAACNFEDVLRSAMGRVSEGAMMPLSRVFFGGKTEM